MADFRFKDLTVDNAFDFCEVLAVIGVEQVIGAFDKDEIQQLQESGTDMKEVGIVIAMKVCGILIKNISKARNEICKFFANCMEWDNGTAVTADDVKKFKLKQFVVMVKDFAKKDDLMDFFEGVAELVGTEQNDLMNAATVDMVTPNPIVLIVTLVAGLVVALITLWNTNDGFREAVTNAWEKIKEVFGTVIDAIKGFFSGLVEKVQTAWESVKEAVTNVFTAIADTVSAVWETIKNVITVGIMLIGSIIDAAFQIITLPWRFIWENCKEYIISAWNYIKDTVSSALNIISSVISDAWNTVSSFLTYILSNIKNKFVSDWNAIKSVVSNVLLMISLTVTSVMNSIWSVVSSILNVIKSVFSSAWNGIKSVVSSAVNNIKSVVSSGLNGAKSTVTGVLNSIRSAFSSVWDGCKNIVGNAIGHIKSLMNFSWSLPSLKLPHFSISGKFSLHPPSVPKLGIEWYKKAMDDGMIMNQPTIFGYNAKSNQFLAGGEAGSETVVGTQNLMEMIQEAVNNAGSGNGDSEATRALLEAIFNWMRNGGLYKLLIDVLTNGVEFEFDNREIARLVKKYA